MSTYTVRSGDTLGEIAARYRTSVASLAAANGLRNANLIRVGQRLRIGTTQASLPIPAQVLRVGARGNAVRQLQNALVRLGHLSRAAVKTGPGIFGPRTLAAVKAFQRANHVRATGLYGPLTRAALARALTSKPAPGVPGSTPTPTPPTPSPVPGGGNRTRPAVVSAPSPNFDSRGGKDIDTIVLHHTGSNSGAGAVSHLRNPQSGVSAHYVLDRNGTIYQLVGDEKRAWHAGKSALHGVPTDVNARSIGIEIVNDGSGRTPFTAEQYRALGQLVGYLKQRYDVPMQNIVGHKEVALPRGRKSDPAANFNWSRLRASIG